MTGAGEGTIERGSETYEVAVHELTGAEGDRIFAGQARRRQQSIRLELDNGSYVRHEGRRIL